MLTTRAAASNKGVARATIEAAMQAVRQLLEP